MPLTEVVREGNNYWEIEIKLVEYKPEVVMDEDKRSIVITGEQVKLSRWHSPYIKEAEDFYTELVRHAKSYPHS